MPTPRGEKRARQAGIHPDHPPCAKEPDLTTFFCTAVAAPLARLRRTRARQQHGRALRRRGQPESMARETTFGLLGRCAPHAPLSAAPRCEPACCDKTDRRPRPAGARDAARDEHVQARVERASAARDERHSGVESHAQQSCERGVRRHRSKISVGEFARLLSLGSRPV